MLLRSFALLLFLLVGACSSDRGFRFYGEYEAEQSHYRIQLISQGFVKAGDDLADSAVALVQVCPTGPSTGKPFRVTLTAAPGQWTKVASDDVAISSKEVNWRGPQAWLKEALGRAGYQELSEAELTGSARVKEQIKSLVVRRDDIIYGYKVMKERPPKEWIGSSELPLCATFE